LDFGFIHEGGCGAKIKGALRTIEHVLLEGLPEFGRQLIEQVSLRCHLPYCFAMIHWSDSLAGSIRKMLDPPIRSFQALLA
jgi:hypothetical protein